MSCAQLREKTVIVGEKQTTEFSQVEKNKEIFREAAVINRQSLRIALLKMEIDASKKKRVIIFAEEIFPFGQNLKSTPEKFKAEFVGFFPEFAEMLGTLELKKIPLLVYCEKNWKCQLFESFLSFKVKKRTQFLRKFEDLLKVDQNRLYFSLGGRKVWRVAPNGIEQKFIFDLKFPPEFALLDDQAWLSLQEISNK